MSSSKDASHRRLKGCETMTPLAETYLCRFPLRRLSASQPAHNPPSLEKSPKSTSFFGYSKRESKDPRLQFEVIGVNLDFPSEAEVQAEFADAPKAVEERPCSMMKAHKTVKNQALIQEVMIS
ncbi:hypothetical protein BKA70DRAFT_1434466 [Coprinopsis sp. MPI-PUGE-AT-0042]|nr:hypothetical protein BKA70DRAFT_1434466 [Coprinopsis sp. MPI-PUGE-AT-0042]